MTLASDVCVRAIHKVRVDGMSHERVARELMIHRNSVRNILRRYDEWNLIRAVGNGGTLHCDRRFDETARATLRVLLKQHDSKNLADYVVGMAVWADKYFTVCDIRNAIKELGMARKIRTQHNNRANEDDQDTFRQKMYINYKIEQFMWMDAASFNPKTGICSRGYAAKGEQTQTKDYYWHKGPSYMLYAVVDCTRLVAFMLVEGSCDADSVIIFIQHLVAPKVRQLIDNVLVLDNAGIHHAAEDRVRELLEAVNPNAAVEFLPPYSPELNPIEMFFGLCKATAQREPWSSRLREGKEDVKKVLEELVVTCGHQWNYRFVTTEPAYTRGLDDLLS